MGFESGIYFILSEDVMNSFVFAVKLIQLQTLNVFGSLIEWSPKILLVNPSNVFCTDDLVV